MKKIILIFLICFTARAYSQTVNFGISAGLNYSNLPGTQTLNGSLSNDHIAGFRAGVIWDIGFKSFGIQPGVLFTTTGGQGKFYFNTPNYANNKIVIDYVQVPVNFLYREKAGSGIFFIGGGPYAAVGVSGKISYATNENYGTTDHLTFWDDDADIKTLDFGMNVLTGYKLNSGLAIQAGYGLGLTNIYHSGANNKNRGFNISADYFF